MEKSFFVNNRNKLVEMMDENSILVLFSGKAPVKSADAFHEHIVNRNFYYTTGIERENIILMITKHNDKVGEILFIEKSDPVLAKWLGEKMSEEEASEKSDVEIIRFTEDFNGFFNQLILKNDFDNIYLDLEKRDWNKLNTSGLEFAKEIKDKAPQLIIKNAYNMISDLRTIKSDEEIGNIRKAISTTNEGIKTLMTNAKPGILEYQLEAYFDFTIKTLGNSKHAFETIAACGKNATVLHYVENDSELQDNELILFDLGAQHENYCADISRTFPVNGKFTKRQKEIYNVVLKASVETMKSVKPGMPFRELNEMAKTILAEGCKEIGLIKEDSELSKYYFHGVSHYLGLDTHDVGNYDRKLEEGMVFTIEPGLYIEEEGIGIRIEDDVLVTKDGYENLSKDIIKTVDEIENFMKNR